MYNSRIALRSRVPRMAIGSYTHSTVYARTLTTTGYSPPPNQPQTPPRPKTGGNSNGLYIGGGIAAIGGALWYYFSTTEKSHIERQGTGQEPRSAQPAIDDATRLAREGAQSVDAAYQDVKGTAKSKVQEAREQASSGIDSGKQRYEEGKDQIGHRVSEARTAAGKSGMFLRNQLWLVDWRFCVSLQRNAWTRLKLAGGTGSAGAGRRPMRPLTS